MHEMGAIEWSKLPDGAREHAVAATLSAMGVLKIAHSSTEQSFKEQHSWYPTSVPLISKSSRLAAPQQLAVIIAAALSVPAEKKPSIMRAAVHEIRCYRHMNAEYALAVEHYITRAFFPGGGGSRGSRVQGAGEGVGLGEGGAWRHARPGQLTHSCALADLSAYRGRAFGRTGHVRVW